MISNNIKNDTTVCSRYPDEMEEHLIVTKGQQRVTEVCSVGQSADRASVAISFGKLSMMANAILFCALEMLHQRCTSRPCCYNTKMPQALGLDRSYCLQCLSLGTDR